MKIVNPGTSTSAITANANLDMGSYQIDSLGSGTVSTQAANLGQVMVFTMML